MLFAVLWMSWVAGCGTRPGAALAIDGGAGGSIGIGGKVGGSGGRVGSGGAPGSGGAAGSGGVGGLNGSGGGVATDGGTDCANVGCAAPPLCSVGCRDTCGCCPCANGQQQGDLICRGGCFVPTVPDASVDGSVVTVCDTVETEYAAALREAQQCTVGAQYQCQVSVRAGFFCACTAFANGGADTLTAIADQYRTDGCQTVCGGICAQPRSATCMADPTSSTGGRCRPAGVLNLVAADNGKTLSVAVGTELDIILSSGSPGSYDTQVMLSSNALSVIEINIPAGPANANGPTRLYRLAAASAGQARVQIPFVLTGSGPAQPTFDVTVTVVAH